MTTPVLAPEGLPYPITIDELICPIGTYIEKGIRLFAYKFWYMVEIASSPDDNDPANTDTQASHPKKKIRESIEFFDAPFEGTLISWNIDVGDELSSASQVICEIKRPCNHDIVYGGLCTQCGKEVDESEQSQFGSNFTVSHTDTNLKISRKEALDIGEDFKKRLRNEKKLVLVVDLDQTVIHCGVDPTIGEWKSDPNNPNYDTLKDVQMFALEEEPVLPFMYMGPKPTPRKCWYYVKVRPGLKEFFKKVAPLFEMHIYTMATRAYALEITKIIDPTGELFGNRILSRDENGSLTSKSLERLFPTDQSMVIIIDDRGDVWNWSPNLIKVVPYSFFVGVGDINSNFLPKQQTTMLQLGRRSREKAKEADELLTDIMDTEKKLQEKIDEEVKRQEKNLSHQVVPTEESVSNETKEEWTKKLEHSASVEVQQQNRPLAALQEHLHNQRLLIDDDDELYFLKDTLAKVHNEYYSILENKSLDESGADIKLIMPKLKQSVFEGCHFVFSGLIPLHTDIRRADIVVWTSMFGAESSSEINEVTTHVITKTPGTFKARLAKSFNSDIKIVHPDWVFECLIRWTHVDEKPYTLIVEEPISDRELKKFREDLNNRKLTERNNEQNSGDITGTIVENFDNTVDLFATGTSWLNDEDEDEIPSSDEDDESSSDEEEIKENDSGTGLPKRRVSEDSAAEELLSHKKIHLQNDKEEDDEEEEDSESGLEDELMNVLDD
ncbi:hypothetical protein KAFR_0B03910 [Kazachstania africana CBS 2517]|uniref:RNA polymerase II subunit A C-terminal domain phosphatase n=1 Tax=Kazachstania africana (strain ATCC 22294 / BCRC 22015 / CBS 2517 / CECT 1963 / NBRC 1671 / NRRL Y-8276) TaxID=1071382 RepID=H2AQN7_KAZAF|nr:hypothetical protein KAFR_0B03910 [Kazachstania africana CBS 2517]CCF56687.1 hypothetical protein KAFR_0B03910 [Kazachstania africana CBS 2517]